MSRWSYFSTDLATRLPVVHHVGGHYSGREPGLRPGPAMFKRGKWGIFALNLTIVLLTFVGVLLHSAAVGVRRSTQANLTVLEPEVGPQQLDRLRTDFAAAQTEADFVNFQNSLERLARKANIELRSVATTIQPPNPHSRTMDHDGS